MHVLFFLMVVFGVANGYTLDELGRLKEHIFKNYDPTARPLFNQSAKIEVTFNLILRSLIHLDMSNGQLAMMGFTTEIWKDETICWNNTEFRDIPRISVEPGQLWTPQIAQLDAMREEVQLESQVVFSDGLTLRTIVRVYYTFCELDMRYYPVDKHVCKFEFMSIKYPLQDLTLVPQFDGVDVSALAPHGEWTVTDTSTERLKMSIEAVNVQGDGIIYKLVLERQPSFNLIHRSIPLAILALCTIFIHIVPLNSGERVAYAVTILLAYVFWQAILADELPKNSSKISIFSMVVTACLSIAGASTVATVILCRVASFESDRPIPERLQNLAKRCRWKKKVGIKYQNQLSNMSAADGTVKDEAKYDDLSPRELRRSMPCTSSGIVIDNRPVTWAEAANSIDVLVFMISVALLILSSITFALIFALHAI